MVFIFNTTRPPVTHMGLFSAFSYRWVISVERFSVVTSREHRWVNSAERRSPERYAQRRIVQGCRT